MARARCSNGIAPLRSVNGYGLFARMTTVRNEIVIEGSDDGTTWQPYEFRWKPGDVMHRPRFVAPHQPRLDWQMWFAALTPYRANPERGSTGSSTRLLEGEPQVLALLADNPFPRRAAALRPRASSSSTTSARSARSTAPGGAASRAATTRRSCRGGKDSTSAREGDSSQC